MAADEEAAVRTEAEGPVLVITINRPGARNAVNRLVAEGMAAALLRLDTDPDLAVGIVTGAGKGFSAGMDLKAFASGEFPVAGDRGFAGIVVKGASKPLIAAVEGFALAGGLEIALACDIIVAARDARLGIPEVGVGLFAGAGALWRLPRRVGLGQTNLLALTGKPIDAEEAHRIGLVDRLAEPGAALDAAKELAGVIAANAPLALAVSKRVVDEGFTKGSDEFWNWQGSLMSQVFGSKDALEGARAFAEKRPPRWEGA
ncbi:MAG: crotonase/enoyl-CoA hydratase family protein [Actinomycetota bacterium]|nr:crotonase/enoyl-CoA hydratase family protein [Actinomycetota bacterium]